MLIGTVPFSGKKHRSLPWILGMWLLCIGVIFYRKPDAFLNPQLWAEDGVVFFREARELGLSSFLTLYAGYYHVFPRFIAFLGNEFIPIRYIPHFYNYTCLAALLWVVTYCFSQRISVRYPALLALALVASPVPGEVYLNLTSCQWVLAFLLILLLFSQRPVSAFGWIHDQLIFIFAGLSSLFPVFFAPVFLFRFFVERTRYSFFLFMEVLLCGMIQAWNMGSQRAPGDPIWWHVDYLRVLSRPLHTILFGPQTLLPDYEIPLQITLAVISLIFTSILAWYLAQKKKWNALYALLCGVMVFLAVLYSIRGNPGILVGGGVRYFFIQPICLLWSLALCIESAGVFALVFICGIGGFLAYLDQYRELPLPNKRWRKESRCIERSRECQVPINPEGWVIEIRSR